MMLFLIALVVLMILSGWKVFEKAGQPGWASIVPIYNMIIMCRIAKKARMVGNSDVYSIS